VRYRRYRNASKLDFRTGGPHRPRGPGERHGAAGARLGGRIHSIFDDLGKGGGPWLVAKFIKHYGRRRAFVWTTIVAWGAAAFVQYLCSFTLEADEAKVRARGGKATRHSWLAKQPSANLESEFRDAADETTAFL